MNRVTKCVAGAVLFALPIFFTPSQMLAQSGGDVSGSWTLTVAPAPPAIVPGVASQPAAAAPEGRGGRGPAAPPTLTLKQEGDKISGTLAGGRGPGMPVEGTISGNSITWTLQRRLADGIARPEVYKGTVNGDSITGSVAEPTVDPTQGYSVDFTAKRNANQ